MTKRAGLPVSDSQADVSPHCLWRAAMDCDVIWGQVNKSRNIPSFFSQHHE